MALGESCVSAVLNLWFGARAADGYANPVPAPIARLWGDHYAPGFLAQTYAVENGRVLLSPAFFQLMRLGEVKTLLSLWPLSDPHLTTIAERPPVFSYALPDPWPHARLVRSWSYLDHRATIADRLGVGYDHLRARNPRPLEQESGGSDCHKQHAQ